MQLTMPSLTALGATYPAASPAPPDKLNKSPRPPDAAVGGAATPPPLTAPPI